MTSKVAITEGVHIGQLEPKKRINEFGSKSGKLHLHPKSSISLNDSLGKRWACWELVLGFVDQLIICLHFKDKITEK